MGFLPRDCSLLGLERNTVAYSRLSVSRAIIKTAKGLGAVTNCLAVSGSNDDLRRRFLEAVLSNGVYRQDNPGSA